MADPSNKKALEEIGAILRKYDLCGQVVVCSTTHAEFRYFFDASWSCIYFEGPGALRVRMKSSEFKTKEQAKTVLECSIGTVMQMKDVNALCFHQMGEMASVLGKYYMIEHEPFKDFEPHNYPDNKGDTND